MSADSRGLLPRAQLDVSAAVDKIRPVVEAVREHGFVAIREATERFDGVRLERLRVPAEAIAAAAAELDPEVRAALTEAIARARKVHTDQRRTDVTTQVVPGGTVTERWVPVSRDLEPAPREIGRRWPLPLGKQSKGRRGDPTHPVPRTRRRSQAG